LRGAHSDLKAQNRLTETIATGNQFQ